MNFELKTLSLPAAAKTTTDTLIVLISEHFQAGKDPLSALIAKATQAKDFSAKAGKSLQTYSLPGISASKTILLGVGRGQGY
jgi:leucyl aminopeptidase